MKLSSLFQQTESNFKNEKLCRHWSMPWLFLFVAIPLSLFLVISLALAGIWLLCLLFGLL